MAGDWIKIEHVTPDKPEVHRLAYLLGITPEEAFGRLVRVWIWADQQSLNGHALSVTRNAISHIARRDNFAQAMEQVGWLVGPDGELDFPNFDRHNTETAKARALANKRQQKHRIKSVTQLSRSERDKSVTREEKRREEENPPTPQGGSKKPRKTKAAKAERPRNDLFDVLAEVTGSDATVASVARTIGAKSWELASAKPPYTPDEVREFGRRFHEFCPHAARDGRSRPTAPELVKWIGLLRAGKSTNGHHNGFTPAVILPNVAPMFGDEQEHAP